MAPPSPLRNSISHSRASEDTVDGRYSQEVFEQDPIYSPATEGWEDSVESKSGQRWRKMRHAVGIVLLLVTVFLWTASNFLASTIFADSSYSKPYLVTYINTAFFIIPLIPMLIKHAWDDRSNLSNRQPLILTVRDLLQRRVGRYKLLRDHESSSSSIRSSNKDSDSHRSGSGASEMLLLGDDQNDTRGMVGENEGGDEGLTLRETVKLSLEFCILWFTANYFAAACLSYTTVASATILGSTSSIWTLLCGALLRVERFTLPKFFGVLASLAGVILISSIDLSGSPSSDLGGEGDGGGDWGTFPHKSPRELALGDAMAFISALMYGFYAVLMKKRIGSESRVNMPLFFGLVGFFNVTLLWPGLFILHWTTIEPFELPPTNRILAIVLVNSASSLISDFSWAYAMLLTSPLVVSVGLSLTIPLSLVGQMVVSGQYASAGYWMGAVVMFVAFVFVNREETRDEVRGVQGGEGILSVEDGKRERRDRREGRGNSALA